MLIVADVGNTNITIGTFGFYSTHSVAGPTHVVRLSTNREETVDEYIFKIHNILLLSNIEATAVRDIAVASVVPDIDAVIEQAVFKIFGKKPFFLTPGNVPILKVVYKAPSEIGADRLAGALGAFELKGGPVIVVDFGTATTFDCVTKAGEYLGGAIVPGLNLAARALQEHTARLPRVDIIKPKHLIGTTTIESIQSGIYYGYIGLVKEILCRLKEQLRGEPDIIATGGLAELICKEIPQIKEIIPELTLEGIRIAWEKNLQKNC
jgi:type III pantothenate kinase